MASLQTLRNKGGVIVAIVIGIALLAFVLGDMLTSGSMLFGNGNSAGKINGTTITYEQYSQQVNTLTEVLKVTSGSETITEEQSEAVRQQAWDQLVVRYTIDAQLADAGIVVGLTEMTELLTGRYVSPMVQQLFTNPESGQFDAALVRQFIANIDQDPTGRLAMFWSNLQQDVHTQAQLMKFKALVDKGSFITSQQAQFMASLEGVSYSVRFVAEKLSSIADSTVVLTEGEVKSFYQSHAALFDRSISRSIDYVVFDALPSVQDYAAAAKYMTDLRSEFEGAADVRQFVALNSQSPFDTRYYKEGEMTGDLGQFAFEATVDQIYAPEISGDQYTLARIADVKVLPDSVNFSHIVVAPTDMVKADSLADILSKKGADFAALAQQYSLDPQSAANAGVVGTLDPQTIASQFSEPLMAMQQGEIRVINTQQAIHIIRLNSRIGDSRKVQLGVINYTVEPSEVTRSEQFNKASAFIANAKGANFQEALTQSKLTKRQASLTANQRELQGYKSSREAVRWAYNAEVGQTSDVMEFGDSFVVVSLTSVVDQGVASLDAVRGDVEKILRLEKKADMLAVKLANGSVDELSAKYGIAIIDGSDISFSTYLAPEVGFDIAFAGGICGTGEGRTSKPIKGKTAVYVAQVTAALSNPVSPAMVGERMAAEQEQSLFFEAYRTMVKSGEVEDRRYRFF